MFIQRKRPTRVVADEEIEEISEEVEEVPEEEPVDTDLLFEAEDVAELVAEVTGEPVDVDVDDDQVVFTVGEGEEAEEYTIVPDGDEEILEAVRKTFRGKKNIKATRKVAAAAEIKPDKKPAKKPAKAPVKK